MEAVVHRYGERQGPQNAQYDQEEGSQRVQYQRNRLEQQFQKAAEKIVHALPGLVFEAFRRHARHCFQVRRRPSQILDLAFIFLVVDQIRRFRIPCHRLVFQLLPLLGILPYVQRLAFHYIVAAGNHRTHDAVESSQNECGEEHDARTQTKRSEERVNVNRLGSRKSLPHP